MTTKARVLEVTATLKPAGAEHVVVSLASHLNPARFEVGVVSLYDEFPGGLESELRARNIPVWHLGKKPGLDMRMYGRLLEVVREFRPDVIHSHCYVTRYLVHLRAKAMVHTVHNLAVREADRLGRLINRFEFFRGVVPVAVGDAVAESVKETYGLRRPEAIPNGIELDRYWHPEVRESWRRANGFSDEDVLVVSVGRLEAQKNPGVLAEAIQKVPGAHLLLVGQGELRESLEGRERVHLLGVRDDVPAILAAADVFALASDWEGLPLALVEAMAAGLPVVATAVGCVPEVVLHGVTGWLIAPGDEYSLAAALTSLAGNGTLRREMGTAGRRRALQFSVDAMVCSYERLFSNLLDPGLQTYN